MVGQELHNTRRVLVNKAGSFQKIVDGINFLVDICINTSVEINLDQNNIEKLEKFLDIANKNKWSKSDKVVLALGRVDDRFLNTDRDYLLESELLCRVLEYKSVLPPNTMLSFLTTTLSICKKIGLIYEQEQSGGYRENGRYCWATSNGGIIYFDALSNAYRCTYTVGRPKYAIGTVDDEEAIERGLKEWRNHNLFELDKCCWWLLFWWCRVSHMSNPDRQCNEEL